MSGCELVNTLLGLHLRTNMYDRKIFLVPYAQEFLKGFVSPIARFEIRLARLIASFQISVTHAPLIKNIGIQDE